MMPVRLLSRISIKMCVALRGVADSVSISLATQRNAHQFNEGQTGHALYHHFATV